MQRMAQAVIEDEAWADRAGRLPAHLALPVLAGLSAGLWLAIAAIVRLALS